MKPSEIKVGKTYINRGAGRTRRRVLGIGDEHRPPVWLGAGSVPDEPGVLYEQYTGKRAEDKPTHGKLCLSSFARWAGKEVV